MDYLGFRRGLFAAVAPYDQHLNDAGRAYALASGVFALAGLAGVGAGCAYARASSRKASAAASHRVVDVRLAVGQGDEGRLELGGGQVDPPAQHGWKKRP